MELLSKAFGIYETNCYILKTAMGDFIIDAGVDSAKWVVENVRNPLAILNTHGHFDHIWCNAELRKILKVPIYCPKGDAFMLKRDCFDLGLTPCAADFEVEPNEIFRFGDIAVEFMHFAGHTPGCSMIKISGGNSSLDKHSADLLNFTHPLAPSAREGEFFLSLRGDKVAKAIHSVPSLQDSANAESWQSTPNCHIERSEISQNRDSSLRAPHSVQNDKINAESNEIYIFSGDFIFYRTIGRSDFPYSSPSDMRDSLQRFGKISYNATLYPGHGQSTTIKDEQQNLPFYLRAYL